MSRDLNDKLDFYEHLLKKQNQVLEMPSNKRIAGWALSILEMLFPQQKTADFSTIKGIELTFHKAERELEDIMRHSEICERCPHQAIARRFFEQLPTLYASMLTDADAILDGDPAAKSLKEVIRTYPGFLAIAVYRIAHQLYQSGVPLIPRILTEYAHSITGIDIHPGATIGDYLSIDHGTGVVIGETTIIGKHVKLYQGVTLGALSVEKILADTKRHPTIEDNVIIYSNATILGGETVIGHDTVIGGNVWLTASVAPYMTIYHQANTKTIDSQAEIRS
ncbi:MAG: serine acetyltransferase [Chitinophagaceae bacterium]